MQSVFDAEQLESVEDDAASEDLVIDGSLVSGGSSRSHSSSRPVTSAQVVKQLWFTNLFCEILKEVVPSKALPCYLFFLPCCHHLSDIQYVGNDIFLCRTECIALLSSALSAMTVGRESYMASSSMA